jgi:predicted kinase
MLIILSGRSGAGKTTIAREAATQLGAVHVRVDSIEQAMRSSALATASIDDAGYRVGYVVAGDNLRVGRTVIADSVNPIALTRAAWREVALTAGATAIEVEVICSDAVEHRRRVETRSPDIAGHMLPSWAEVIAREYDLWDRQRIVIDTATASLQHSVDLLRDAVSGRAQPTPHAARLLVITGSMGAGKTTVMAEAPVTRGAPADPPTTAPGARHVPGTCLAPGWHVPGTRRGDILSARGVVYAAVDFDGLAIANVNASSPQDLASRNFDAMWRNYAAAGIDALLVAAALESRGELDRLRAAVAADAVVVCRLRVPIAVMQDRVRVREPGMLQATFVERAAVLEGVLDAASLEDFTLVNDGRSVTDVALEMLVRAGWLES